MAAKQNSARSGGGTQDKSDDGNIDLPEAIGVWQVADESKTLVSQAQNPQCDALPQLLLWGIPVWTSPAKASA